MSEQQQIKTINFDNQNYNIEDLTPRAIEGFNMLIKLNQELADITYQLKKCQAAQVHTSEELKGIIEEDKIKPVVEDKPEE
jgi:hypothetical protein